MRILLIADNEVDLGKSVALNGADVSLFPLTSHFTIIEKIKNDLGSKAAVNITVIDSAELINREVTVMQDSVHEWSQTLANHQVKNKKLKDWFMLPDGGGSSWWFGLIAEKNSVQDDAFFKIAQINALEKYLQKHSFDIILIALSGKRQAKIIKHLATSKVKDIHLLPCTNSIRLSRKQRLLNYLNGLGIVGALFSAAIYWLLWLRDSRTARKNLQPLAMRAANKNKFLYVTYFPNLDSALAEQGIFRNKYAGPLQEKLAELNLSYSWLAMPVFYNGHNFASAMQLAKKFTAHGEHLFVLQEFFTLKIFFKAFYWWLRQAFISFRLLRQIDKTTLTRGLTHPAALPILRYMWWHSFVGTSGTRGIIFYLTYLEVFKKLPHLTHCLYYCEMQAWEKALVLAKKKQNPALQTMAFQHTVVMKNFFNYFYAQDEIKQTGDACDFPLPDQLIANGKGMHALLSTMQHPNLIEAEAIRHLYISRFDYQRKPQATPVMLVVGSYDRVETKSLITLVHKAFPHVRDFEIWFKGSPVNPMDTLFKELGINWEDANYQLLTRDISELLPQTKIALVANTTVSIEAVAFGCALIIPLFADTMMMNPIVDTQAKYHLVSNPEQLADRVAEILQTDDNSHLDRDFIGTYWHLDSNLPRWTQILTATL